MTGRGDRAGQFHSDPDIPDSPGFPDCAGTYGVGAFSGSLKYESTVIERRASYIAPVLNGVSVTTLN